MEDRATNSKSTTLTKEQLYSLAGVDDTQELANDTSGYLYSPNYPDYYPHNYDGVYRITVSYGYIELEFYEFDVEYCSGCGCDALEVCTTRKILIVLIVHDHKS